MDAIELGRQTAAALHAELVALGCDGWNPMAIVRAAAKRRLIDISAVKPGSNLLGTARAAYDPTDASIIHEETGSDFLDAFLIGHELGHATLALLWQVEGTDWNLR